MTNLHLTDKNGFQREGFTDFLTGPLIYLTPDPVPHLYFSPNPSSTPPLCYFEVCIRQKI